MLFSQRVRSHGQPQARRVCALAAAGLVWTLLVGCGQPSEPNQAATSTGAAEGPASGFGQVSGAIGVDVTSRPGRSAAAVRPEEPATAKRRAIVAFGDSLTAGLGVPPDAAYPAQLQRKLDRAGYRYHVINAGVSGDTTAGGLRRVEWVLKSRPSIVIVEFGGNDGLRGLDLSATRANLDQMIRQFQEAGVRVVLVGMKIPPNYGKDYSTQLAGLYPALAKTYRLPFMPFFLEGVAAQPELNQADGIHPTAEGYRLIVERLFTILEPLLDKAG